MGTKKTPSPSQKSKSTKGKVSKSAKVVRDTNAPIKKRAQPKRDKKSGRIKSGVAQDTNKNGTAGAPTKYDKKFIAKLIDYFSGEKYERVVMEMETRHTKQGKTEKVKYRYVAKDLPHLEAFARSIGVNYSTLYNWAHEKDKNGVIKRPEFLEAYNTAKELQKEFLIENGLKGHYPPASFIFVAKNITDMRDTKDIKVTPGEEDGGISDAELEEALFN